MLFVVVGIVVGLAVALGPLAQLAGPVEAVNARLAVALADVVERSLGWLAARPEVERYDLSNAVSVLSVCVELMTPALVALLLVAAAEGGDKVRSAGGSALIAMSLLSFLVLPVATAVMLLVVAVSAALFFRFASGLLLRLPCWVLATVTAVSTMRAARAGEIPRLAEATSQISDLSQLSPDLVRLLLAAVAVTPVVVAAGIALRKIDG